MLIPIHEDMLREALSARVGARALQAITAANIRQDAWHGQIGHDEYHYDNNALAKSDAYIIEQREMARTAVSKSDIPAAWAAFGRLTHTAQDFYSHTNYIPLWLDSYRGATPPTPPQVDPLSPNILQHSNLRSGRIYFPLDFIYFLPGMREPMLKILPKDSHAWMNLDSPKQGPLFEYARAAAIKRTVIELERVRDSAPDGFAAFCGL